MSKKETPLTRRYWESVGGTLVEEFAAIPRGKDHGPRTLDAVIVLGEPTVIAKKKDVELEGKDIIIVQTKASRLGMYLMGQTVFSKENNCSSPLRFSPIIVLISCDAFNDRITPPH